MNDQPESSDNRTPPRVRPVSRGKKTLWPTVLGAVSLVIAILVTLLSVIGLVLRISGNEIMGGEMGPEVEQAVYEAAPVVAWLGWVAGGLSLLLLWGFSVGLLIRRRWGISLGRALAVMVLFNVLLSICSAYYTYPVIHKSIADMPGGQGIEVFTMLSIGFGFVINITIGVAILFWLGSARAKHEWHSWPR